MLTPKFEARMLSALTQIKYSSLLNGDMGVCIFLFIKGREKGNAELTAEAENILKRSIEEISANQRLDLTNGITGIALGLAYLVKNNYVEGDINDILSEIDEKVYKKFSLKTDFGGYSKLDLPLTDLLMYYIIRHKQTVSENMKELQRRVMTDLINWTYMHRNEAFYDEPYPFSLTDNVICMYLYELALLYSRGFERERIKHILVEMEYFLFSRFPALHSNRLLLTAMAAYVAKATGLGEWTEYAKDLRQRINFDRIYGQEMTDKNIFPVNGLIGVWLAASFYNHVSDYEPICLDTEFYKQRIMNSSAWDRMEYDDAFTMKHYSLNGYCGVRLFLDYLNKRQ